MSLWEPRRFFISGQALWPALLYIYKSCCCTLQVTEEVAAHLKEGRVSVKPYEAMLDDVREAAGAGLKLWTDPAKVCTTMACMTMSDLNVALHFCTISSTMGVGPDRVARALWLSAGQGSAFVRRSSSTFQWNMFALQAQGAAPWGCG